MRRNEGSYTVEAAFVFPMYLILLTVFLLLGFYLYDKTVLSASALYYAKSAIHMADEPVDVRGEMELWRLEEQGLLRLAGYEESFFPEEIAEEFQRTVSEKLFLAKLGAVDCSFQKGTVRLRYEAQFQSPIFAELMEKLGVTPLFSGEVELSRQMSPEEFVRIVRGIVFRSERE